MAQVNQRNIPGEALLNSGIHTMATDDYLGTVNSIPRNFTEEDASGLTDEEREEVNILMNSRQ